MKPLSISSFATCVLFALTMSCGSQRGLPKASEDLDADIPATGGASGMGGQPGSGDGSDASAGASGDDAATSVPLECALQDRRCLNNAVQECRAAGWTSVMECSGLCLSSKCVSCKPEDKRCGNNQPEACDSTGEWKSAGAPCESGCNDSTGLCNGCSTSGEKTCTGKRVFVCSAAKKWVEETTCNAEQGCLRGACTACEPGVSPTKCDGNNVVECGANGQWQEKTECAKGCVVGTTTCKVCTPNTEKRCAPNGSAVEKCNAAGTGWVADSNCSAPANGVAKCTNAACAGSTCNDGFQPCGDGTCRTECPGIIGLGDLPGGYFTSYGLAIDATGSSIVGCGTAASGLSRPYRWTKASGMVELPMLSATSSCLTNMAMTPDARTIVGMESSAMSEIKVIGWSPGVLTIADSGYPGIQNSAVDVSQDGNKYLFTTMAPDYVSWLTVAGGSTKQVFKAAGMGMSSDSNVILGRVYSESGSCGVTNIGPMPADAEGQCFNAGIVTKNGKMFYGGSKNKLLRWRVGQPSLDVFALPSDVVAVGVYTATADGSTVFGIAITAGSQYSFIWTEASGASPLADWLISKGVKLTGWSSLTPASISADGKVVTGQGGNALQYGEAFRLVLP